MNTFFHRLHLARMFQRVEYSACSSSGIESLLSLLGCFLSHPRINTTMSNTQVRPVPLPLPPLACEPLKGRAQVPSFAPSPRILPGAVSNYCMGIRFWAGASWKEAVSVCGRPCYPRGQPWLSALCFSALEENNMAAQIGLCAHGRDHNQQRDSHLGDHPNQRKHREA